MANISSADGTLTLRGSWTQEALDAFLPVLASWEFYGAYGIQWCDTHTRWKALPPNFTAADAGPSRERWNPSTTGRETGSKTALPIRHILTQEQYDRFLTLCMNRI